MYKHGAMAQILDDNNEMAIQSVSTIPIYFGTAPIGQIDGFDKVNKPILIESLNDAMQLIGYNENFAKYTLCEAIYAHFKNSINPIGPIVLINCLDPLRHKATTQSQVSLTFINNLAKFEDEDIILSSFKITGNVKGTDYKIEFAKDYKTVLVYDLKGGLTAPVDATYSKIDTTKVTDIEVITSIIEGLPLVYQTLNVIPTLLCAPGFSDKKTVNEQLLLSSQKINGHWYAFINSDIPSNAEVDSVLKAITYKSDNKLSNAGEFLLWPMAKKGALTFHLSTLCTVLMQQLDRAHDGVPFEEPSNKRIDIENLCTKDGNSIEFDKENSNKLNAKGIVSSIFWGGKWVLWGVNTSLFEDGVPIAAKDIFGSSVRMLYFIANEFQNRYGLIVDKPMNRNLVDTILNDFGAFMDSLISRGALLSGKIYFDKKSNPDSDIVLGDFVFDLATTTTPPAKSLTLKIAYTSAGQSVLFN